MDSSICTSFTKLSAGIDDPLEWSLLYFAFFAHRCAIRVKIDSEGHASLVPFVNLSYDNRIAWSDSKSYPALKFKRGDIKQHYQEKCKLLGGQNELEDNGFLNDSSKWWLNGHTLCNVVPKNVWSLRGLKELQEMLTSAKDIFKSTETTGIFVINKRDSPMLPLRDSHPFPCLSSFSRKCHVSFQRPMRSPISFYVGPEWADIAMPVPEAWQWSQNDGSACSQLVQKCFHSNGNLSLSEFRDKKKHALFRGTATGAGLDEKNQRLKLVSFKIDEIDAGITAWNRRDRVIDGFIDFQVPLTQLCSPMSPVEQSKSQILLCVDGHQASSRLVWYLASGCVIIIVDSSEMTLAPRLWIHDYLKEDLHYVRVKSDFSDLQSKVRDLLLNQDEGFRLASTAYKLANTILRPRALSEAAARAFTCAQKKEHRV
jgi:hypothetical protein